jgi:drug/metabolite transporter (DMT)-like permease
VNSSLLVNMVPLVTPFFLVAMVSERLARHERIATLIAMLGVLWLGAADYRLSPQYLLGDLVCFGSMILFAVYLVLGRRNRDFPSVWLYMWPTYLTGAVVCSVIALGSSKFAAEAWTAREVWLMLGLGVIPTVFGHGSLNFALKGLRGQVVGVANLAQVIFAGLLAYFILDEVPHASFYPASALIALGVVLVFRRAGAER